MVPRAAHASAPGKVILFGEHAVVYGEPSLSLALERRIHLDCEPAGGSTTVNGELLNDRHHSYIRHAVALHWRDGPLRVQTRSELPSAGGIGSSAALSVATVAALLRLRDDRTPTLADVARGAFETELAAQGAASPNDTSVSTAGGAVVLSPKPIEAGQVLWRLEHGDRAWTAQRVEVPPLPLVVANSGTRARTADQVAKVRRRIGENEAARGAVPAIGAITLEAIQALAEGDLRRVGDLMNQNHELLRRLGADTAQLNRLVDLARGVPGTLGAKLTGAGGGGCLLVLSEEPSEVVKAFAAQGVAAFEAGHAHRGVEVSA